MTSNGLSSVSTTVAERVGVSGAALQWGSDRAASAYALLHQCARDRGAGVPAELVAGLEPISTPERRIRHVTYLAQTLAYAHPSTKRQSILDVGCGIGLNPIGFAALTGARSVGVELLASCVEAGNVLHRWLPADLASRLSIVQGDARRLDFGSGEFDVVVAMESISHIIEVDEFLSEVHRVLAPGGSLIITDSNNGANPLVRWHNRQVWRVAEEGPPGAHAGDYTCAVPYRSLRAEIIRESAPQLEAPAVEALARQTSGLTRSEIEAAVDRFLTDGTMPGRLFDPGRAPVNPRKGYYLERTFRPSELTDLLSRHGFEVTVRPYFGGARGGFVALANQVLASVPMLTFPLAKALRVCARRPPADRVHRIAGQGPERSRAVDYHITPISL